MQPPPPVLVAELFPRARAALLKLLRGLSAEQWASPTVCAGWSVHEVTLVAFINRQNELWVQVLPHSVVDNSDFSPTRLTAWETRLMLASQGVLSSPHFKQRGSLWSFMCTCSCLWSVSSSLWHCFGVLTGSLFGLPPHEEGLSAPRSTVCSSLAAQTIAPPVVSSPLPRRVQGQRLCLCVPGARSKIGSGSNRTEL
jgi:hypothetical protein